MNTFLFWIGYDNLGRGNKDFRYSSTGIPSTITGFSSWNALDSSDFSNSVENCVAFTNSAAGMDDRECSELYSSVCELEWMNNAIDQADGLTDKVLELENVNQQMKIFDQDMTSLVKHTHTCLSDVIFQRKIVGGRRTCLF